MTDKLYKVFFLSDQIATRVTIAASEFIWAIALAWPGRTFERSRTYHTMSDICTEETWAIIWLLSAIAQTLIIFSGNFHSRVAVWFAGINALLWGLVVVSLYANIYPINGVASGDCAIFFASVWIWIRSGYIPKPVKGVEKWM